MFPVLNSFAVWLVSHFAVCLHTKDFFKLFSSWSLNVCWLRLYRRKCFWWLQNTKEQPRKNGISTSPDRTKTQQISDRTNSIRKIYQALMNSGVPNVQICFLHALMHKSLHHCPCMCGPTIISVALWKSKAYLLQKARGSPYVSCLLQPDLLSSNDRLKFLRSLSYRPFQQHLGQKQSVSYQVALSRSEVHQEFVQLLTWHWKFLNCWSQMMKRWWCWKRNRIQWCRNAANAVSIANTKTWLVRESSLFHFTCAAKNNLGIGDMHDFVCISSLCLHKVASFLAINTFKKQKNIELLLPSCQGTPPEWRYSISIPCSWKVVVLNKLDGSPASFNTFAQWPLGTWETY